MRATTNQLFERTLGLSSESESSTLEIANIWKMETAWIERREGCSEGQRVEREFQEEYIFKKFYFLELSLVFIVVLI